jgi:putative ABC transport system permease protein
MALGAQPTQILTIFFIRYGLKLALLGLGFGILASFAFRRGLARLIFGVSTGDPAVYVLVTVVMLVVALLACYIPARRAAKVDPLVRYGTNNSTVQMQNKCSF